jgi:phosphatidylcholine synthase
MGSWLAWMVHLYTASGALLGLWALAAIRSHDFRLASLLMMLAMAVDGTDGLLARRLEVRRRIPWIDGRRLDDICDFFTYVLVPAFMLIETQLLPHPAWAAVPVLASAYGFSQDDAKTEDDYFLGFPSYWNVVAMYLYLFHASPETALAVVLPLGAGVFVPTRYIYPTKTRPLRRTSMVVTALWAVLFTAQLCQGEPGRAALWLSLALGPGYYLVLSFWLHFTTPRQPSPA